MDKINICICRKVSDKIKIGRKGSIVPPDGALSAAVDVMSFTHDIVMMNDSIIFGALNACKHVG